MDKTMLRNQALGAAQMRAKAGQTVDEMLAEAERIFRWLVQDAAAAQSGAGQEPKS